ncbi:MAG: hypothetical protein OXN91_03520 [Chloroflexota bacterium]|nr:hypothetical protein [Chloroflexota bacterium]
MGHPDDGGDGLRHRLDFDDFLNFFYDFFRDDLFDFLDNLLRDDLLNFLDDFNDLGLTAGRQSHSSTRPEGTGPSQLQNQASAHVPVAVHWPLPLRSDDERPHRAAAYR